MTRGRLAVGMVCAFVALACAAVVRQGTAASGTEVLPDLVADAPGGPVLQTYSHPDQTNHLLLRFEGYLHNRGSGAVEVRGSGPAGGRMSATVQRVYRSDRTWADDASRNIQMVWEPQDGHQHWHIQHAARYSLWNAGRTAMVAPAMKVGFCLIDSQHVDSHGPGNRAYTTAANDYCAQGNPQVPRLVEGISAGWRDVYVRDLAFQWVDVTDVQPGTYWLRTEVDPDNWVRESNESNSAAYAAKTSTIPGYVARPVDAGIVGTTAPTHIQLATSNYGSNLGSPQVRIVTPPRHGRLDRATGAPFQGATVVYTPGPGWVGPDPFTYEVRDSASEFPRNPARAAVTLNVGGVTPAVAISGAPASMYTGTSVPLTAHLLRAEAISWAVDGIPGGSREVGTIDGTGLYSAPAQVPPSGHVTIRATTASGAWEEVTIGIVAAARAQAAPAGGRRLVLNLTRGTALYGIRATAHGDALMIRVRSRRAGVVRVRARRGKQVLGRCRARTPARRVLTCKVMLRDGVVPPGVRIVFTLRVKGKLVDMRRASIRLPRLG
jgi:Lysyl oxidase